MAQRIVSTFFNRYPEIFTVLRDLVAKEKGPGLGGEGLRILSFGCSRGDELQSLRCYFPDATLLGCDVDIGVLNQAYKISRKQKNTFVFLSNQENLAAFGPFDIVVSFSVLCRYPTSEKLDNLAVTFSFDEYETLLSMMDSSLVEGGYLAIYNANYRLKDWSGAPKYSPVESPQIPSNGFVDIFDKSGRKIAQSVRRKPWSGHRLVGAGAEVSDDDLTCAIYRKGQTVTHTPWSYPVEGTLSEMPFESKHQAELPKDVATFWLDSRPYRSEESKFFIVREWRRRGFDGAEYGLGAWVVEANVEREKLESLSAAQAKTVTSSPARRMASVLQRRINILFDKVRK